MTFDLRVRLSNVDRDECIDYPSNVLNLIQEAIACIKILEDDKIKAAEEIRKHISNIGYMEDSYRDLLHTYSSQTGNY